MVLTYQSPHTFHIPVMGIAFTIDTPVKVARFGISSVISIIEDRLIEMMRKHYYPLTSQTYFPITRHDPDYRAKRITDYLNLVNTIVDQQIQKLKAEAFEKGSEIVKYFEMLSNQSRLKQMYLDMINCSDENLRKNKEQFLRTQITAGSIDVNIMTKIDREQKDLLDNTIADGSDAVTSLRGFINSNLNNSSVVFSAGMNPRLYSYLENQPAFYPQRDLSFNKKVIVKVSDFRSALIQGKFLAKKGIWVSEFRIESGLNCGGHAFASDGYLMGPILEEFKMKREELTESIFQVYKLALQDKLDFELSEAPSVQISVQGGIGTHEEDSFLRKYYNLTSTGWGTPFLLVPEATTVDEHTLSLLAAANEGNVCLSNFSPLGVRFHYLKGTTADDEKLRRIESGKPGSPCTEKHLAFNTEFTTEPICTASSKYQKLKLAELDSLELEEEEYQIKRKAIIEKECLCVGLSNAASLSYNEPFLKNLKAVNICPGPNIVNFSKIVSLQTMTDHIYGKTNVLSKPNRPHVFIAEINLYLDYLEEQLAKESGFLDPKRLNYYKSFVQNMENAFQYYLDLPEGELNAGELFQIHLLNSKKTLEDIKVRNNLV